VLESQYEKQWTRELVHARRLASAFLRARRYGSASCYGVFFLGSVQHHTLKALDLEPIGFDNWVIAVSSELHEVLQKEIIARCGGDSQVLLQSVPKQSPAGRAPLPTVACAFSHFLIGLDTTDPQRLKNPLDCTPTLLAFPIIART